ncbi:hypothetical protein SSCG_02942 [Streptomyces clavuligerus]|nr:hypothetical protein SSCG_02942 [Streptomyces clavuligerus]
MRRRGRRRDADNDGKPARRVRPGGPAPPVPGPPPPFSRQTDVTTSPTRPGNLHPEG